jgi:hypothetical protein
MRKILVASLLLITILLSACGSKATATPITPTPTVEAALAGAQPGQCQVSPALFQPQSASVATYAPISNTDHIEGSDTAVMTLIEYSDFT